ncbi:hypothetical protein ACOSQ3_013579 [Xanthoceras sorbifolium]
MANWIRTEEDRTSSKLVKTSLMYSLYYNDHVRECSDNTQGILNDEAWRFGAWIRALAPFGGHNRKGYDESDIEGSGGGTFSGSTSEHAKAETEKDRDGMQVDMGGDKISAVVISRNEEATGSAAPKANSVEMKANNSLLPFFIGKGMVFLSPKHVLTAEVCEDKSLKITYIVEKPQQLERADSVGHSETAFYSVEALQSDAKKISDKGADVNSQPEKSTTYRGF